MECADVVSMNGGVGGMPVPPCTPSPQPGDKAYLHEEDDMQTMGGQTTMCDGTGVLTTQQVITGQQQQSMKTAVQQPMTATVPQTYYTQYYQYASVPNAGTPHHYGPTVMYMPMPYYHQQMRQGVPTGYHQQMDYNTTPATTAAMQQPTANPKTPMEPPTIVKTPSRQRVVIWNYCQFCQNNREPEEFFRGHILRDADGKVVCPVLRAYNCPICNNGGGDKAHTKSYCPQLRPSRLPRRPSLF